MKIGICAKVTPDTTEVPKASGDSVDTKGLKFVISPYDDFAIEEAVKTKETAGGEVVAFTVHQDSAIAILRKEALARGADKLVIVNDPAAQNTDTLGTAKVLAAAMKQEEVEIAFFGKVAIDDNAASVPAMVAELLGWAQVTNVVDFSVDGTTFTATRAMDGGVKQVVTGSLPVAITAERGLNTPRYAKLPAIMKAKKKPVAKLGLGDLGLSADAVASNATYSNYAPPAPRPAGRILEGDLDTQISELVRLLREEAKVI